jgi:hypothetical protein
MLAVVGSIGTGPAYAQESAPGPGAVVITIIPGGGTFFTEGKDTKGPSLVTTISAPASRSISIVTSASKVRSAAVSASIRIYGSAEKR